MSDKYPQFVRELKKMGYRVISSDTISIFPKPEQQHADMQILPIDNDIFLLSECSDLKEKLHSKTFTLCENLAGYKYPENVLLNFLYLNGKLYGKKSAIDSALQRYCNDNHIEIINVNQGYARCSTLVINESAVITSDRSIEKALKNNGVDVFFISSGNILLDGFDYGFIGGASGKLNENTIIFFGNVKKHPDYTKIKDFCNKYNMGIKIISEEMPLTDIGGIVKVE